MPHYYFNLHNSEITLDGEGKEFPDLAAATVYATEAIRSLAAEAVMKGHLSVHDRVDIADDTCQVLHSIEIGQVVEIDFDRPPKFRS